MARSHSSQTPALFGRPGDKSQNESRLVSQLGKLARNVGLIRHNHSSLTAARAWSPMSGHRRRPAYGTMAPTSPPATIRTGATVHQIPGTPTELLANDLLFVANHPLLSKTPSTVMLPKSSLASSHCHGRRRGQLQEQEQFVGTYFQILYSPWGLIPYEQLYSGRFAEGQQEYIPRRPFA